VVKPGHVLDDLVRVHDVERVVLKRPTVVEVVGANVEAVVSGELRALRDDLQGMHARLGNTELATQDFRPCPVVAAEVQEEHGGIRRWERFEDPGPVRRFGVGPQTCHEAPAQAHEAARYASACALRPTQPGQADGSAGGSGIELDDGTIEAIEDAVGTVVAV
jgi:hypothetical protein